MLIISGEGCQWEISEFLKFLVAFCSFLGVRFRYPTRYSFLKQRLQLFINKYFSYLFKETKIWTNLFSSEQNLMPSNAIILNGFGIQGILQWSGSSVFRLISYNFTWRFENIQANHTQNQLSQPRSESRTSWMRSWGAPNNSWLSSKFLFCLWICWWAFLEMRGQEIALAHSSSDVYSHGWEERIQQEFKATESPTLWGPFIFLDTNYNFLMCLQWRTVSLAREEIDYHTILPSPAAE